MNCPGHVLIFGNDVRSYRDLPMRIFEFGTVYRHEMSGVVHGLMRARGFTQDDAHIFCTAEQVHDEVIGMLDFVDYVMGVFGFEYSAEVSTRPEKSIGEDEDWELATNALIERSRSAGSPYEINEGDGAFYGPKIDIKLKDAIGRTWQCSTIQVDFNFPERFGLTYRTADNTEARPFMLHRTILGSHGALLRHPHRALRRRVPDVARAGAGRAHPDRGPSPRARARPSPSASQRLGVRTEVYAENEPMRVKIAKAQQQKVPVHARASATRRSRPTPWACASARRRHRRDERRRLRREGRAERRHRRSTRSTRCWRPERLGAAPVAGHSRRRLYFAG